MYSSTSSPSNNPFIDDPTNPSCRFPDINALERSTTGYPSAPVSDQSSYASRGGYNPTYAAPGQPQSYASVGQGPTPLYLQQSQSQSQSFPGTGTGGSGWGQQPQQYEYGGGFLSTSSPSPYASASTSNPVSPQMTGMPYQSSFGYRHATGQGQGYPSNTQFQMQPAGAYGLSGYGGYGQQSYPLQHQANMSEFDPLRQLQTQTQTPSSYAGHPAPQSASTPSGSGPSGQPHPREYIRMHKAELEQWDAVSWKQALNSFDALRAVWEGFKEQIGQRLAQGRYYLGPAEEQRLQGLQKDATNTIDSITASSLQMQEAFASYRQSSDLASRNRVRESLNASISCLPDWPPQSW